MQKQQPLNEKKRKQQYFVVINNPEKHAFHEIAERFFLKE